MLWLESVIGTVVWCWRQVPARRYTARRDAFELDWRLGPWQHYYDITVLYEASTRKTTQEKGTASDG
jgi:hypothetical protein